MTAFSVITLTDESYEKLFDILKFLKVKDTIKSFKELENKRGFFVSFDGISKQLHELLIQEQEDKLSIIILNLNYGGYYGHAGIDVWEWLQVYHSNRT